jgi:hypothetical protein
MTGRLRPGVDRQRPVPKYDAFLPLLREFEHRLAVQGHRRAVVESEGQEGRLAFEAYRAGAKPVAHGEIGNHPATVTP